MFSYTAVLYLPHFELLEAVLPNLIFLSGRGATELTTPDDEAPPTVVRGCVGIPRRVSSHVSAFPCSSLLILGIINTVMLIRDRWREMLSILWAMIRFDYAIPTCMTHRCM